MTSTHRDKHRHQNLEEKIAGAGFKPQHYEGETMEELNQAIDSLLEQHHRRKSARQR